MFPIDRRCLFVMYLSSMSYDLLSLVFRSAEIVLKTDSTQTAMPWTSEDGVARLGAVSH